jgi:hypothetical protein
VRVAGIVNGSIRGQTAESMVITASHVLPRFSHPTGTVAVHAGASGRMTVDDDRLVVCEIDWLNAS